MRSIPVSMLTYDMSVSPVALDGEPAAIAREFRRSKSVGICTCTEPRI